MPIQAKTRLRTHGQANRMTHTDFCFYSRVESSRSYGCVCEFEWKKEEVMEFFCKTCNMKIKEYETHSDEMREVVTHYLVGVDPATPNSEQTWAHNTRNGHVHEIAKLCDDCLKDVQPKRRGPEFLIFALLALL